MIKLPKQKVPDEGAIYLPYNGQILSNNRFSFSFACFDRSHELFNLGCSISQEKPVSGEWFIDLLDCLKSASNMTIHELKTSIHDLHPVNWKASNVSCPLNSDQLDFYQFRISKSKGRIIGIKIDNTFYVVWLDPHHNFSDSEGYGRAKYYKKAKCIYEMQEERIKQLENENERLKKEIDAYEELINE